MMMISTSRQQVVTSGRRGQLGSKANLVGRILEGKNPQVTEGPWRSKATRGDRCGRKKSCSIKRKKKRPLEECADGGVPFKRGGGRECEPIKDCQKGVEGREALVGRRKLQNSFGTTISPEKPQAGLESNRDCMWKGEKGKDLGKTGTGFDP